MPLAEFARAITVAVCCAIGILRGAHAQSIDCRRSIDEMSMADIRTCEARRQQKELSHLQDKACSATSCIYKLTYAGPYRVLSKDGHSTLLPAVKKFVGSGYTFIVGMNLPTQDGFGALLIDPDGRQTVVSSCTGTACGGVYDADGGPLRGAIVQAVGDYWLLTLPRE